MKYVVDVIKDVFENIFGVFLYCLNVGSCLIYVVGEYICYKVVEFLEIGFYIVLKIIELWFYMFLIFIDCVCGYSDVCDG